MASRPVPWRPCLAFVLLPLLVFPGVWLRGEVPFNAPVLEQHLPWRALRPPASSPGNPVLDDPVHQFLPWEFTARRWARGLLPPAWNPDAGLGAPFLGNPQTALWDPLRLLTLPLPVGTAWLVKLWLRLTLAGLFAYGLGRHLGFGPWAAALVGLGFSLGGFVLPWLAHPHAGVALWFPALLWAGSALLLHGGRGPSLGLIAAWTLGLAAGHPETSVQSLLLALPFWLVLRGLSRRWWCLGATLLLGTALAAPLWVPFVAYLGQSTAWAQRTAAPEAPVPWRALATWVLPRAGGWPLGGGEWALPLNANEVVAYVGLLPWLLLPWAWRGAKRRAWAALTLAGLGAAGAFGFPGVREVLAAFPAAAAVSHRRLLLGAALGVLLLGAAGWEGLRRRPPRSLRAFWLWGGGLFLAALLLAPGGPWAAVRRGFAHTLAAGALVFAGPWAAAARRPGLLLVLALADLLLCWGGYHPTVSRARFYPWTPALAALADRARPGERVLAVGVAGRAFVLPPNTLEVYGLAHPDNYDALGLPGPQALWEEARAAAALLGLEAPAVRLTGARWVAAALPLERVGTAARLLPGRSHTVLFPRGALRGPPAALVVESYLVGAEDLPFGTVAASLTVRTRPEPGRLLERHLVLRVGEATAEGSWPQHPGRVRHSPAPVARVFTVRDARRAPFPRYVYRWRVPWPKAWGEPLGARITCRLRRGFLELEGLGWEGARGGSTLQGRFTPFFAGELYLYENPRAAPRAFLIAARWAGDRDAVLAHLRPVQWQRPEAGEIEVSGRAEPGDLLVVLESFAPGWAATDLLQGRELPVRPALGAFLAVQPDPGPFRVRLRYAPRGEGLALALAAAAAGLALVLCLTRVG